MNRKPSFLTTVVRQRAAHHRLTTTRSEPEIGFCRRVLQSVPLADVELSQLPLVKVPGGTDPYVVLGEIAQLPGKVLLIDLTTGAVNLSYSADQLELVSPG